MRAPPSRRSEAQEGFAIARVGRIEAKGGMGRIVALELARRRRLLAIGAERDRLAEMPLDLFPRQPARPEEPGLVMAAIDDRRFEADRAGPAIEDEADLAAEARSYVPGRRRR